MEDTEKFFLTGFSESTEKNMKTVRTEFAELNYDERESILYIRMFEGANMTLELMKNYLELMRTITEGRDYFALIDATRYFAVEVDALKYPVIISVKVDQVFRLIVDHLVFDWSFSVAKFKERFKA